MNSRSRNWWITVLALFALTTSLPAKEITGHHHAGDRIGRHGMALFGKSVHYLAHIPMTQRPHNEQLIMRVTLLNADGEPIEADFSAVVHSVKPLSDQLSLDDLVVGEAESFEVDVFRGNFEHQAPRLLSGVTVRVDEVLVARNLVDEPLGVQPLFYLFGDDETWLLNVITPARSRQEIHRAHLKEPAPSLSERFAFQVVMAPSGQSVTLMRAGLPGPDESLSPSTEISLERTQRMWCLEGPGFFKACSE